MGQRLYPGQDLAIKAADWNTMQSSAEDYLRRVTGVRGVPGSAVRGFDGIVTVKNYTGQDCSQFAILAIAGMEITPEENLGQFLSRPIFTAVAPASDSTRLVILQQPLKDNAFGAAMIMGMSPVQVDVASITDQFATPIEATFDHLASSSTSGPFRILYAPDTGLQWCAVIWPVGGGAATATHRYCKITARSGDAPPFTYSAVEVMRTSGHGWQTKTGGITMTNNLRAWREAFYPGCGKIPLNDIVEFWAGESGMYLTPVVAYPPAYA